MTHLTQPIPTGPSDPDISCERGNRQSMAEYMFNNDSLHSGSTSGDPGRSNRQSMAEHMTNADSMHSGRTSGDSASSHSPSDSSISCGTCGRGRRQSTAKYMTNIDSWHTGCPSGDPASSHSPSDKGSTSLGKGLSQSATATTGCGSQCTTASLPLIPLTIPATKPAVATTGGAETTAVQALMPPSVESGIAFSSPLSVMRPNEASWVVTIKAVTRSYQLPPCKPFGTQSQSFVCHVLCSQMTLHSTLLGLARLPSHMRYWVFD